jgi:hypothetical protein
MLFYQVISAMKMFVEKNKHFHCFSIVSLKKNLDEECSLWLVVDIFKQWGFKTGG